MIRLVLISRANQFDRCHQFELAIIAMDSNFVNVNLREVDGVPPKRRCRLPAFDFFTQALVDRGNVDLDTAAEFNFRNRGIADGFRMRLS